MLADMSIILYMPKKNWKQTCIQYTSKYIMLYFSALNSKGTVKMDIPQGKVFEPTYIYKLLKLNKYDSAFKVPLGHFIMINELEE